MPPRTHHLFALPMALLKKMLAALFSNVTPKTSLPGPKFALLATVDVQYALRKEKFTFSNG
jgi:hypothetical protein